jgi:hypothetical protein
MITNGGSVDLDLYAASFDSNKKNLEIIAILFMSFIDQDFSRIPHAAVRIYEGTNLRISNVIASYSIGKVSSFSGHVVCFSSMAFI